MPARTGAGSRRGPARNRSGSTRRGLRRGSYRFTARQDRDDQRRALVVPVEALREALVAGPQARYGLPPGERRCPYVLALGLAPLAAQRLYQLLNVRWYLATLLVDQDHRLRELGLVGVLGWV